MSRAEELPLVAFDWSARCVHVTFDGHEVTTMATVADLLDSLDRPHRIVAEATFESWDAARRQAVLERVARDGHEMRVYRPLQTDRVRTELGVEKSDSNDARVIYRIAADGLRHVYPVPTPDPAWCARRACVNEEYRQLRVVGGKADLVAAAVAVLGPYRELDEEAQSVLGNPKTGKYSQTLLAAVTFAAQRCPTRAEFERMLGLHGSAYPSLLRSEVHHHSLRHVRKRGVSATTYRRQLRRAYRLLHAALGPQAAPAR